MVENVKSHATTIIGCCVISATLVLCASNVTGRIDAASRIFSEEIHSVSTEMKKKPEVAPLPDVVKIESLQHSGHAKLAGASTTVGVGNKAVRFCAIGILSKKGASSVQIRSVPMCANIGPFETKTIDVPWLSGSAIDVCTANGTLNWDNCDYNVTSAP